MIVAALMFCFSGCSFNARMSNLTAAGHDHQVELWSGGTNVQTWTSSGKVATETNSDGYFFTDKTTGKLVRVTGDLVITTK